MTSVRTDKDMATLDERCRSALGAINGRLLQRYVALLNEGQNPAYAVLKVRRPQDAYLVESSCARGAALQYGWNVITAGVYCSPLNWRCVPSQVTHSDSSQPSIGRPSTALVARTLRKYNKAARRYLASSARAPGTVLNDGDPVAWKGEGRGDAAVLQAPSVHRHRRQLAQSTSPAPTPVRLGRHVLPLPCKRGVMLCPMRAECPMPACSPRRHAARAAVINRDKSVGIVTAVTRGRVCLTLDCLVRRRPQASSSKSKTPSRTRCRPTRRSGSR